MFSMDWGLPLRRGPGGPNWSGPPPDLGGGAHSRGESCRTPGSANEHGQHSRALPAICSSGRSDPGLNNASSRPAAQLLRLGFPRLGRLREEKKNEAKAIQKMK
ncbi:hypothetical protein Asppvi_009878 [Aspergillus pseudoviridinutans]|uniref:Uncharacterized protein n=1 Tax=Aspergillus pseudoviridinutans TaxID=1517512 RepID=A0A9P3BL21_9EURO|nr:uncharacterized protein Asppvi_009878 [Aspergillus pseudoviridinutans]GIJ90913.1 hypothetical protein Asppvi_009878 [Aspergillus pseudoviridinutans]